MTPQLPFLSLILGILLIAKHLLALLTPTASKKFLHHFPRSRFWGTCFLIIAALWAFSLTATTDLGEFSPMRHYILIGIIVGSGLFWYLVSDFLAVRSLGFILLLVAHPLLETTFLKSGLLPLLLSLLAYAWIIAGLFFVGMPYLLRNAISAITAPRHEKLWKLLACLGLIYGLVLAVGGVWMLC